MTRAWRALDQYDDQRASVRTWLYRIATNACMNALQSRKRRPRPADVAFEAADVSALQRLVLADVVLELPPMRNWYRGAGAHGAFMTRIFRTRGTSWRTVQTGANDQAACAAHVRHAQGGFVLHTVQVFTIERGRMARVTVFQDAAVFALFDLPNQWAEPMS